MLKGPRTHGFFLDGGHEVNQTWITAIKAAPAGHEVREIPLASFAPPKI